MSSFNTYSLGQAISLIKRGDDRPWEIIFKLPEVQENIITTTVGEGGKTQTGPRLQEILSLIATKANRKYPYAWQWNGKKISDSYDFDVQVVENSGSAGVIYIEMSPEAHKIAKRILEPESAKSEAKKRTDAEVSSYSYQPVKDVLPNTNKYLLKGLVTKVRDGDTIEIKVTAVNPGMKDDATVNGHSTIRFVGVQTPETKKSGEDALKDAMKRNSEYGKQFNMTAEDAFIVAEEAKDYIYQQLMDRYVIVDIDRDSSGKPKKDMYDRWLGIVYKVEDPNYPISGDGYKGSLKEATNLNKTLIANESKYIDDVPLATVYDFDGGENTAFDVSLWDNNYSFDAIEKRSTIRGEIDAQAEAARKELEDQLTRNNDRSKISTEGHLIRYGQTLEDIAKEHGVTIEDIARHNDKTVEEIRDYIGKNPGGTIGIPVYITIPNTDREFKHEINPDNTQSFLSPIDDRGDMASEFHLRIGDVELVVPPISIQVNRNSQIQKVKTLRSKSSIITKVGSSDTTITLQLYFHDLDSINGRKDVASGNDYYYVDGLRPLLAQFQKAPFLPVENEYLNDVHDIHNVAMVSITAATVPGFPHSISATLTLVKFEHEAYMPQVPFLSSAINYPLLRWYYQQSLQPRNSDFKTYLAPIQGQLTNDFYFTIADEDALRERQSIQKELRMKQAPVIFDEKVSSGKNLLGRLKNDANRIKQAQGHYKKFQELKAAGDIPFMFKFQGDTWRKIYGDKNDFNGIYYPREYSSLHNGEGLIGPANTYLIKLEAEPNINLVPASYKQGDYYYIPVDKFDIIQAIIVRGDDAQFKQDQYRYEYNKLAAKAEATEGQLPMVPYYIPDLLVTSMQVMYENSFGKAQVAMLDSPTFQFLGGQDPYIQLTIETINKDSVTMLKNLLQETERFSRQYRYGITSGFIGIENQLTALFGIKSVFPESVQINTVPGFPGRFQIEMTLCGFNKTQKRSESLEGLSPVGNDVNKDQRHIKENPIQKDSIIIEQKMKDLEVYPDLELPTYMELNEVITTLGAGLTKYPNPSGAKYLDPDFYVTTNQWTVRKNIDELKNSNNKLNLIDGTGAKIDFETGTKESPIDGVGSQQLTEMISEIDQKTKDIFVGTGTPEDFIGPPVPGSPESPDIGSIASMRGAQEDDFKTWVNVRSNLMQPLTLGDYIEWFHPGGEEEAMTSGKRRAYEGFYKEFLWESLPNPKPIEVYKEIYRWVDALWVKNGYVTTSEMDPYTYASVEDIYKAAYKVAGGDDRAGAPSKITVRQYTDTCCPKGRPGISRERMANYLKALFDLESDWGQYEKQGNQTVPKVNKESTACGIGQIMLYWHGSNRAHAKRLLWDWKYNLEFAIKYYFSMYETAAKSSDVQYKSRPWDWAVRGFNQGNISGALAIPYFAHWKSIFDDAYNSPSKKQNSPIGLQNDIFQARTGKNLDEAKDIAQNYNGTTYGSRYGAVRGLTSDGEAPKYGAVRGNDAAQNSGDVEYDPSTFRVLKEYKEINNQDGNRLVFGNENPNVLMRDMFTDVVEYDQRGRLIRAFPTFQMFIVDEGRWMTSYKLWDNLYGFNAIQSIDVHKSRKIAADTCVIKMSNVYSNLTSRMFDVNYGEWDYDVWDNLLLGRPSEQLVQARKELVSSLMLQTGARIHLRIGYGADATNLPVVFNGTITELDTQEVVTILAQGDGIELTNVIAADPSDDTSTLFVANEPRDILCELITSKGNWFKDVINATTDGIFFKDNPLGILHFGAPTIVPEGTYKWFNDNYGEAAQNIYSTNGMNTFSQWVYRDETDIGWTFGGFSPAWPKGDEKNLNLRLQGMSTWDVAQTIAYVTPDYIAAVHPFEMRSSLFLGKPYYRVAYRYDSAYEKVDGGYKRTITTEFRKPYMQFHVYSSEMDIIGNKIKASNEDVYTNAIATYADGSEQTNIYYADFDIHFNMHKTAVVESPILTNIMPKFFGAERQAGLYAASTVRDYIKDMYKGQLIVLGDPSVKPYDMCYMQDQVNDMNGPFLVKEVTHHFSFETGFITSIAPDALAVTDDSAMLSMAMWVSSIGAGITSGILGRKLAGATLRKIAGKAKDLKLLEAGKWTRNSLMRMSTYLPAGDKDVAEFQKAMRDYIDGDKNAFERMQKAHATLEGRVSEWEAKGLLKKTGKIGANRLLYVTNGVLDSIKDGSKIMKFVRTAGTFTMATLPGAILGTAVGILTESLSEAWRRKKAAFQCVIVVPLYYQGREYTAGINGHKGMIVGDAPGAIDQFFMGAGFDGKNGFSGFVGKSLNWLFDDFNTEGSKRFSYDRTDLAEAGGLTDFNR